MKENILKQEVNVIGVRPLDFKTTDGSRICGYKIFYTRDLTDTEKKDQFGKASEFVFFAKDTLDDLDKFKNKVYPCRATLQFEVQSTTRKPKFVNIVI